MPLTPWKAELSCFSDADYCAWAVYDQENNEVCRVVEGGETDARLIAQAPAMYELLKELEWFEEDGGIVWCPVCKRYKPGETGGLYNEGHLTDCRLAAVLKAVEGEDAR